LLEHDEAQHRGNIDAAVMPAVPELHNLSARYTLMTAVNDEQYSAGLACSAAAGLEVGRLVSRLSTERGSTMRERFSR
jgi:hypothetical protein